jgi:hypothetical protein
VGYRQHELVSFYTVILPWHPLNQAERSRTNMYSDLGFLDFGEPPRTPFFSLQSPVPRFESGRRLQVSMQVRGTFCVSASDRTLRKYRGDTGLPTDASPSSEFPYSTTSDSVIPLMQWRTWSES